MTYIFTCKKPTILLYYYNITAKTLNFINDMINSNFKINYQKLHKPFSNDIENPKIFEFVKKILYSDRNFLYSVIIYSVIISILGVAVPISVQLLINSVSFTAMIQPVIVLGMLLLFLLIFSGTLNALQIYTVEIFQRRIIASMSAKLCTRLLNADIKKMEEANMPELINRFFDVVTLQKTVPKFLVKTISFLFQAAIGLILVSLYHPFFLLFSAIFIFSLYLIYVKYFKKACITAFLESRRKYDIVASFEDLANNTPMFKSQNGQDYAKFKIDELTRRYITDRKSHFKNLFSQTILLLILYAISSTALLILGGYLVLKGELTIGQLVAAELILSAILYSTSHLSRDFENMYDLIAACEKLSVFFNIPIQKERLDKPIIKEFKNIHFDNISSKEDPDTVINLKILSGKNYLIHEKSQQTQKFLVNTMFDFERPAVGEVKIDNQDLYSYNMANFRNQVKIINNKPLMEGTLLENLTFGRQDIQKGQINQILQDLGLDKKINQFPENLNLRIIPTGWPLNEEEVVLIKIAHALIFDAQIIIVNEILDIMNFDLRQKILEYITKNSSATVIYFSNHKDDNIKIFDQIIEI